MVKATSGLWVAMLVAGCSDQPRQDATGVTTPATTSGPGTHGSSGTGEVTSTTSVPPSTTSGPSSTGNATDDPPKLDLGLLPDVPGFDGCENIIPTNCDDAATCPTTVGASSSASISISSTAATSTSSRSRCPTCRRTRTPKSRWSARWRAPGRSWRGPSP